MTRKRFLQSAAWAMVFGGGAAAWINRRELLTFLRSEKAAGDEVRILRRPFPAEPSREISALGFGTGARMPILGKDKGRIDEELVTGLMDYFVAHGLNYFDTGYEYHFGESERFLGRTLGRYPREEIWLADKMPTWLIKKPADAPRIFEEQLARCQVEYFDNYLLHSVKDPEEYDRVYRKYGVLDYLKEEKRKGRIRHLGVSFHGRSDLLQRVLDDYPFASVQVMLNALECRWNPDAVEVARILAERRIPIFIMEPLAGGRVARLNGEAMRILRESDRDWSPAEWGFRYAMSFPGTLAAMSAVSRREWAEENVRTFSKGRLEPLSEKDRRTYGRVIDAYMKCATIPCTACRYCVPCPYGVRIPEIFAWWNSIAGEGRLPASDGGRNDSQALRRAFLDSYSRAIPVGCGPEKCIKCRACKVACPQWTFDIPTEMRRIDKAIAKVRADYRSRQTPPPPPGTMSAKEFLQRCTGCNLCIARCPSKVLVSAGLENGLPGVMLPRMDFSRGFCPPDCTACADVCPAGAIRSFTPAEKKLHRQSVAVYDRGSCLVARENLGCGNCAEHCPQQAIAMVKAEDGRAYPEVTADLCTGCGACEYHCPVKAIIVVARDSNTQGVTQ